MAVINFSHLKGLGDPLSASDFRNYVQRFVGHILYLLSVHGARALQFTSIHKSVKEIKGILFVWIIVCANMISQM